MSAKKLKKSEIEAAYNWLKSLQSKIENRQLRQVVHREGKKKRWKYEGPLLEVPDFVCREALIYIFDAVTATPGTWYSRLHTFESYEPRVGKRPYEIVVNPRALEVLYPLIKEFGDFDNILAYLNRAHEAMELNKLFNPIVTKSSYTYSSIVKMFWDLGVGEIGEDDGKVTITSTASLKNTIPDEHKLFMLKMLQATLLKHGKAPALEDMEISGGCNGENRLTIKLPEEYRSELVQLNVEMKRLNQKANLQRI